LTPQTTPIYQQSSTNANVITTDNHHHHQQHQQHQQQQQQQQQQLNYIILDSSGYRQPITSYIEEVRISLKIN
jgi:lysine/ornithine N-monooxygenase